MRRGFALPLSLLLAPLVLSCGDASSTAPSLPPALAASLPAADSAGERQVAGEVSSDGERVMVREERSGVRVSVALSRGVKPRSPRREGALVRLDEPLGAGTARLVHLGRAQVEDFVLLPEASATHEVRYTLWLDEGAAGLRQRGEVLEVLDGSGAPRLRAPRPYVTGADGARTWATLRVEGCEVDTDAQAPWRRAPRAPGADRCTLVVRWQGPVRYPALVDPAWESTAAMAYPRAFHTQTLLSSGLTLVTGGVTERSLQAGALEASCELYDPATQTWAMGEALAEPRAGHRASRLPDGGALITGGLGPSGATASVERFAPSGALLPAPPPMGEARGFHAATVLPSGGVLVTGGIGALGAATASAEVFSPVTSKWNGTTAMRAARSHHAQVLLDGSTPRVLVAGGQDGSGVVKSAELYDPAAATGQAWALSALPIEARTFATLTELGGGRALLAGGCLTAIDALSCSSPTQSAEIFSLQGGWGAFAIKATTARWGHAAERLRGGDVLLIGGLAEGSGGAPLVLRSVERFMTQTGAFTADTTADDLKLRHGVGASSLLPSGAVLVSGGLGELPAATSAVDLLPLRANGAGCTTDDDCGSGHCASGVCCDSACTGACRSCKASEKQSGPDGVCGVALEHTNPRGVCVNTVDAQLCGQFDSCDDSGACKTNLGAACGDVTCAGGVRIERVCQALGASGCKQVPHACAPFACAPDGTSCASECGGNLLCAAGAVCKQGTCVGLRDLGESCSADAECALGHCVDGACCDSACDSPCMACNAETKQSGDGSGACGPAKIDSNPGGRCKSACASGAYKHATCGELPGGAIGCVGTYELCGPYACDPASGCASGSCTETPDACSESGFCAPSGLCEPKLKPGASCEQATDCASGHCVDGVCCDSACDGPCMACSVESKQSGTKGGTCGPARRGLLDPRGLCLPDEDDPCGQSGACDGYGRCAMRGEETSCGVDGCVDGLLSKPRCDGKGGCSQPTRCAGDLGCVADEARCREICSGDGDCRAGTRCTEDGQCIATGCLSQTRAVIGGEARSCQAGFVCLTDAPGRCVDQPCQQSSDCDLSAGMACHADGTCRAALTQPEPDAACGCSTPGASTKLPWAAACAAAALLSRLRAPVGRRRGGR